MPIIVKSPEEAEGISFFNYSQARISRLRDKLQEAAVEITEAKHTPHVIGT